jgi:outer membrane receptor protein involved in Fe transport
VPVYHKITLENYAVYKMDPQNRELGYLRFNHKFDNGILKSAMVTASMHNTYEGREMRKNGSNITRLENDKVRSLGLSAEALISSGKNWSSNNGIEVYNDRVGSTRTDTDQSTGISVAKRGLYPDGATMNSIALFTIHTFNWTGWNISAGGRFNAFIINVSDEVSGQTRLTPSSVTGNLAILRKLNNNSNLFISGNSGFRAPNIDDLGSLGIVDFRYEIPNYELKPEHSFQYQIGYKYQNNNLRGEIYLYRNELYNLIVRNKMEGDSIEGYQVYMKENVERAFIQGIETAWDWDLNESWAFTGSITYTYGQNLTQNEPARRIPPLFCPATLEYSLKNWWIGLEFQAAGKQDRLATGDKDDNRIPPGGTPGWDIFNINSGFSMKHLRIDLSFLNLFNVDYRFHGSGINSYGRSAFITVAINI